MAMESITKKRKIAEEKRKFIIQWTEKYFVSELFGNIICLICDDKISVCKENNIKRHYSSKHQSEYQTFNPRSGTLDLPRTWITQFRISGDLLG